MCSYMCARSTAHFSPLSCLACHQGNNEILETIISTCKNYIHKYILHFLIGYDIKYPTLCLPPIIVLVQSFILICCKKSCLAFSQTSYRINESLFSLVLKHISFTAWTSFIRWERGLICCWQFKDLYCVLMTRNVSCCVLFERSNGSWGHNPILFVFLYILNISVSRYLRFPHKTLTNCPVVLTRVSTSLSYKETPYQEVRFHGAIKWYWRHSWVTNFWVLNYDFFLCVPRPWIYNYKM